MQLAWSRGDAAHHAVDLFVSQAEGVQATSEDVSLADQSRWLLDDGYVLDLSPSVAIAPALAPGR